MKPVVIAITLLVAFAALPLAAQQDRAVDLTIFATSADVQGSTRFSDTFDTEFESGEGFGLSADIFMTKHFSTEIAAFAFSSDAALTIPDVAPLSLGSVDMTPVMAGVRFHLLGQSRFDPYIGVGAAYVMADDLESAELNAVGVGAIDLENELTYYVNAGLGFQITNWFGLVADGRYIPYEPSSKSAVTGVEEDLDLTTLLLSAGVRFRF